MTPLAFGVEVASCGLKYEDGWMVVDGLRDGDGLMDREEEEG